MSVKPFPLKSPPPQPPSRPELSVLVTGRRYRLAMGGNDSLTALHGLAGGYQVSTARAGLLPLSGEGGQVSGFFWDPDLTLPPGVGPVAGEDRRAERPVLRGNSAQLTANRLKGPEVCASGSGALLRLQVQFELAFHTDACAASLGVIHLVQAQRFIVLKDGTQLSLLDTGEADAVLYLDGSGDRPVREVAPYQPVGEEQAYGYDLELGQPIPDEIKGSEVETVTVLEQYRSYFMQHAADEPSETCIWTPACAPILWGWSIRVGRRIDGPWDIVRRKLILPQPGNDGLEMPAWTANTQTCSK